MTNYINKYGECMVAKTLKVCLKGEDWTFTRKYLIYEEFALTEEDPKVRECIDDARDCLKITPDDEEIKCSMVHK